MSKLRHGSNSLPEPDKLLKATAPRVKVVEVRGYTPLRPLFLDLAEKLRIIMNHRLRMAGHFHFDYDDDSDDIGEFEEDGGMDDEMRYEMQSDEKEGRASGSDEDGDVDMPDVCWDPDMMDCEMRKMSGAMGSSCSDSGSDGGSLPYEDCVEEEVVPNLEHQATCVINGILFEAEQFAGQLMCVDNRGMLRVFLDKRHFSGMGAWNFSTKGFRKWMTKLHHGCDGLLEYNPLRQTLYELHIGWNLRLVYHPAKGADLVNAARMMEKMKDEAAGQKKVCGLATIKWKSIN